MICLPLAVLHPEYGTQFWGPPRFKRDVKMLERLQRWDTKMFSDLKDITYEEMLRDLAFFSVVTVSRTRRLIAVYNYLKETYKESEPKLLFQQWQMMETS